ncbi:MAG: hypothetical protein WBX25_08940 [Rhodomicrobium sp.]
MAQILQLDNYRPISRRRANTRALSEMALTMCETAFFRQDWQMFDRYFRILKSAGPREDHVANGLIFSCARNPETKRVQ